jgi:hypothetical protein
MRLGNRGEAIQFAPQPSQALRWGRHGLGGQVPDPETKKTSYTYGHVSQ